MSERERFAERLALILKVLSMSRARLAADLGVDKSVVSRWVSGGALPSADNLARLSTLLARRAPKFTALDWDRDLESLAAVFGVEAPPTAEREHRRDLSLPLAFADQILGATRLRARSYEGFYETTRPYAPYPGQFLHDQCLVRIDEEGLLRLKMITGGVVVEGWVLPLHNKLFIIASQFTSGVFVFAILHGVNSVYVDLLDGLTLSTSLDLEHTPIATAIVLRRAGGLTDDPRADNSRLAELGAKEPLAPAGSIPEALRRHLARDIGPTQAAMGGDWVLRLPLALSLARGPLPDLP